MTQAATKKKTGSTFGTIALVGLVASMKSVLAILAKVFAVLKLGWVLPTVVTMGLSLVLYGMAYGWWFGGILVGLLLTHELGHWIWMKAYRLNPQSPIFIPFLGAFVAMRKMPANEAQHAWVALAGPLVGGAASLGLYIIAKQTGQPMLLAGTYTGFLLNLFQLIPARPLDGSFVVGAILLWLRSKAYASEGMLDRAELDVNEAIAMGKHDYDVYFDLARYKLLGGHTDASAIESLVKAEQASQPGSTQAFNAAYGILLCGDYQQVLQFTERLKERIDLKAEALEHTGHMQEAATAYDQRVKSAPFFMWGPRWRRAMFYISDNNPEVAKSDLDTALMIAGDEPSVNLTQGWYLLKNGELDDAWRRSQSVLEEMKDYESIDKIFILAGCHRLRAEICQRRAQLAPSVAEAKKNKELAAAEFAAYDEHPSWGTIFVPL